MSTAFDPRITPVRDDLAAAHLKGTFERSRYAEGSLRRVTAPALPLSFAPTVGARLETEILFGEEFTVYDEKDGWAWGQATRDGYVGYLPAADLSSDITSPSHVVVAPASHVYPEPDLKRPPLCRLSFESRVSVDDTKDGFCRIADGGWIFAKHLAPADVFESDYIETGRKLIGIPYLWGGRTVDETIARCEALGFRLMVAVIGDSANLASIRLHEKAGFRRSGLIPAVGFKFGRWVDVVIMDRPLGARTLPDAPPRARTG